MPAPRSRLSSAAPATPVEEFTVAEIVSTHGLHGLVRALTLTDFPENLTRLREVIIEGKERTVMALEEVKPQGQMLLLKLGGVDSLETAQALRGSFVKIPRSLAHPLPPGHHYIADIIGIEVFTEDGRSLGPILDVRKTGSNDVYYTESALIPATREAVIEMDVPGRRMVVQSAFVVE